MKKLLLLGLTLLIAIGCEKDDDIGFLVTDGDRLVRYTFFYESKEHEVVNFIYNRQARVIKVVTVYFYGGKGNKFYEYDEKGKLIEVYSGVTKDKYYYDEEDRINEINSYVSKDGGITFEKSKFYGKKFYYNNRGDLSRIERLFAEPDGQDSSSYGYTIKDYIFEWENGNIVTVMEYNREDQLAVTKLYEYDQKANYRIKHPEIFGFHAEGLSQNNVIKETIIDHLGYYPSSSCMVCKTDYKYNRDGKPVWHHNPSIEDNYTVLIYE